MPLGDAATNFNTLRDGTIISPAPWLGFAERSRTGKAKAVARSPNFFLIRAG